MKVTPKELEMIVCNSELNDYMRERIGYALCKKYTIQLIVQKIIQENILYCMMVHFTTSLQMMRYSYV